MDDLFAEDTFVLLTKDKSVKEKVEEQISESGGAVARAITKRVNIVAVDNIKDFENDIKKAESLKIPVVTFSFIDSSISAKKREKPEDYKPGQSASSADNSGPDAKKQKVDSTTGFHKDSKWMGVSVGSDSSTYPFILEIQFTDGDDFTGSINWPTLGKGALTKVKGTVKGDQVKFEEHEAVVGADDVELPMYYTGKLTGDKLNGKLKDSSGEESTFNLSKIKSSSATPSISVPVVPQKDLSKYKGLPSLTANSSFKGVLTQEYKFTVHLTSLTSEGKFGGTISWPSVNADTLLVGEIKDSDLSFEETKILKGDGVDVPVKYSGKIDEANKSICGTYTAPSSKGSFALQETSK